MALSVVAVPVWAGSSGTAVANVSGFGNEITTLTTDNISGGDVDFDVTATVYQCQNAGGCSGGGGTSSYGEYTYVYSITPVGNSAALSQVTLGNLLRLFLSANNNFGVVTGQTSAGVQTTTFNFGSTSIQIIPPQSCVGNTCDSNLTVGTTLTIYVQSYGSPGNDTISGQDGGTAQFGNSLGPVPEPTSMALFGTGLAFVGAIRRYKKR
ncbi:MAG TPA: PEP-CTERM sorting domain-containing protein [Terriglobales bacterium]